MRAGLLDTIPASSLDGLTAEDFRLLLNGTGEVNTHQLMDYTSFNDESGGMPKFLSHHVSLTVSFLKRL